MPTNVQLQDLSTIETAGKLGNTTLQATISIGNVVLNTATQLEDESLTFCFKGALKNQDTRAALIASSTDPVATQALFDKLQARNHR